VRVRKILGVIPPDTDFYKFKACEYDNSILVKNQPIPEDILYFLAETLKPAITTESTAVSATKYSPKKPYSTYELAVQMPISSNLSLDLLHELLVEPLFLLIYIPQHTLYCE
jgi:hypothetical protein